MIVTRPKSFVVEVVANLTWCTISVCMVCSSQIVLPSTAPSQGGSHLSVVHGRTDPLFAVCVLCCCCCCCCFVVIGVVVVCVSSAQQTKQAICNLQSWWFHLYCCFGITWCWLIPPDTAMSWLNWPLLLPWGASKSAVIWTSRYNRRIVWWLVAGWPKCHWWSSRRDGGSKRCLLHGLLTAPRPLMIRNRPLQYSASCLRGRMQPNTML